DGGGSCIGSDGDDGAVPMDVSDDDIGRGDFGDGGGADSGSEWEDGSSESGRPDMGSGGGSGGIGGSGSDGGGGSSGGSGGAGGTKGADAVRQARYRQNKAEGKVALSGPALAREVAFPALPCLKRFLDNNRQVAADRAAEREGTRSRATQRPAGVGTAADIANIIDLLSESSKGGIKIIEGVYLPRSEMCSEPNVLKTLYNLDYAYDPSNIGVKLDTTEVVWRGAMQKVASFDHGVYTLEDGETTMEQWDLLEARHGNGVTLDVARYVRQQGLMHAVVYGQIVPHLSTNGNKVTGMLLDVNRGLARAGASSDGVDPESKLGTEKLRTIKSKADRVLDFSLKIFASSSVRDILPIPDASGE
ncbi:unnamed protein product, partial [Pylaiella littoralis]